jgi:hypothetical protein
MLAGALPRQSQCFQLPPGEGGYLPADLDGNNAPPNNAPAPFIALGSTTLNLRRLSFNFANPSLATISPVLPVAGVAPFNAACAGGGVLCIPQPSPGTVLDSLGDLPMWRFAYRNFGATVTTERATINHSVTARGTGSAQVTGVRWYELQNLTSGTPSVVQQGTFSPDNNSRWMGSIAMDKSHNLGLGYSLSSTMKFPSIFITGQTAGTGATGGGMGILQQEVQLFPGAGSQTDSGQRWGDYTAMDVDPTDDCTFFYTNQYEKTTGSFNWSTRIGSFKFPGCP